MQITVIDVGQMSSHATKNGRSYQSMEVTYKNDSGQVQSKKLMSFSNPDVFKQAKENFELIRDLCSPTSRLFTTTTDYIDNFEKRIEPVINFTKTSDMYEGKATVAQAFDSMVASRYYSSFRLAMISRLCEEVIISHPEKREEVSIIKSKLDSKVEKIIEDVLNNTDFEVIPIQKLVRVQVGSALIAMKHLKD